MNMKHETDSKTREDYAMRAMQGILASITRWPGKGDQERIATLAFELADEMIERRDAKPADGH